MCANLRSDTVFEGSDNLPAGSVILWIGAEHQRDIKGKTYGVTFNLHITFLHDVEQSNLNLSCQIGQFINGKDGTIGARK